MGIAALAGLAHGVRVEDEQLVQLELEEEFIVSCSASAPYQYCKFSSPSGQYCNFYWGGQSRSKQFCVGLRGRVTFVGSQEDYECALLIRGAEMGDSGEWSCEVGSPPGSSRERKPRWSQTGELSIRIKLPSTKGNETASLTTGPSDSVAKTMTNANVTLLVVCVLVFAVFVAILLSVIFIHGRKKLVVKTNSEGEDEEEVAAAGGERDEK